MDNFDNKGRKVCCKVSLHNKSSAVAEMGDRGHNRHGRKRGGAVRRNVGVLWPNGWMDQDATWYGDGPRPRRHCVRWGPCSPTRRGRAAPHLSAHVYCGQTVAHLSNCLALVFLISGTVLLRVFCMATAGKSGAQAETNAARSCQVHEAC